MRAAFDAPRNEAASSDNVILPARAEGIAGPHATRCVVAGAGSIGRRHLRNLATIGVEAIAFRTMRGQSGALDGWPIVTTWDEVAAFEPSLAVIANPTSLHSEAALHATALGCHVLIEKPMAPSVREASAVAAAVTARGTTAMVGYQFRFHPTLRIVATWLAQGRIGIPLTAHAHWGEYLPGWHPGEDHLAGYSARSELGGGALLTLSHPIDYVQWLLGDVSAVSAMTTANSGLAVDVDDAVSMTLRMTSGALAVITLDYAERPARHTLSITGTAGKIRWDAITGAARLWLGHDGRQEIASPGVEFERNVMFLEQSRHFVACATGAEVPCCPLSTGMRTIAITDAARISASEGRVVHV